jgi:hypothetical protein
LTLRRFHHWDFFGSDSQKTAEHFKVHLEQFLASEPLEPLHCGFFHADETHTCVWLEVSQEAESDLIQTRLRPRRSLTPEDHNQLLQQLSDE